MTATRGYEVVRKLGGGRVSLRSDLLEVKGSGRNREICKGMFVVRASDGSVDGCRGANDTTNGGGSPRKIVGLVARILDSKGNEVDKQYLGTGEAGYVHLYDDTANLVFRGTEDGVGGVVDYTKRSIAQVDANASYTTSELPAVDAVSNDKLDSSTAHATIGQHAFTLIQPDANPANIPPAGSTGVARVHEFTVAGGYLE